MLRGFLRSSSSKVGTGNTRSSWVATFKPLFVIAVAGLWILAGLPAAAFPVAPSGPFVTLTTLAVTSGGSAVTSVASGAKVTLTASVTANGNPVTVGLVNFCDASGAYCTDIHLLGSAQLTSLGTAAISFYSGIGSHSYKAVYVGTPGATTTIYLPSVSSPNAALTVTGLYPTATAITNVTGSAPPYSLTATVTGYVNSTSVPAPAGTVSFLDTTNSNYLLGSSALGASTPGLGFLNSQTAAVGNNPEAIAMGDFNGDGIPDLAVANYALPGTVTILLGQGDGTFKEATAANLGGSCLGSCSPLSAGDGPISVAVGDFNGDGIPDLVVADISGTDSGNGVMVFLGNGDGTFTHKSSPQTTVYPVSVAVGDFNGDGIPDLAVTSQCTNPDNCSGNPGVVTILLGNGDGTFTQATGSPIMVGLNPAFVTTGDFNGDGNIDLAVSNLQSSTVTILMGNGDGTFTEATAANLGGTCKGICSPLSVTQSIHGTNYQLEFSSIAAGDFNGDGIPDLAMTSQSGYLVIFLGQGDGTFTQSTDSPIAISGGLSMPTYVAVGDFNGDGHADLAVTDGQSWNMVSILLGNGDGTFTQTATTAASNSDALVVGDFNRDGVPDLAATAWPGSSVTVLLTQMTQTATVTASSISPNGVGTHNVAANFSAGATYASSTSTTTPLMGIAPASIAVITGNNQSAFVTTAFTTSLEVQVLDAGNNPMPGTTVNFAVPPSGASATLSSYAVTTDSYGEAMVTATANATGGSYTVSAGVGTLSTGFGLTNTTVSGIAVTTLTDDASGVIANCIDPSLSATSCSLRDAIATAAAESSSTLTPTITFASSLNLTTTAPGDYKVTTGGTLNIGASMNIAGPGLKLLSIDGGNAVEVFNVTGGTVSIFGLTITKGYTSNSGGGISNSGTLTVANSTLSNNSIGYDGGGIYNVGALTVTNCTVSGNSGSHGGGISTENGGTLNVANTAFISNSAPYGGGGIFESQGTVNVTNSTFTGNTATAYNGGGIFSGGTALNVANSTFSGNTALNGAGIASQNFGTLNVTNSTFSGNAAQYGGGIQGDGSPMTVINSTFSGNSAPAGGSGIFNEGGGKLYMVNVLSSDSIPNKDSMIGTVISGGLNLAPLGNYGGPTKTMPPFPNSAAICAGAATGLGDDASNNPITLTTTDQRGNPRPTANYGNTCVDAGAVQTAYSVTFTVPPSNPQIVHAAFTPTPTVQLTDNGQPIALPGASIAMNLMGGGSLSGTTPQTTDATGLATFGDLSVSTAVQNVYLMASITGTWGSTVSESDPFNVNLVPQTISITQPLPTTAIYNGVNLNATTSATSTSGGGVIFTIDPSSTAPANITSAGALTISGTGTVIVDANQAGGGSYAAAPQVQQNILVTLDTPYTIVVSSGSSQSAYVSSPFTNNLTAQVQDAGGNGVYNVPVTFGPPKSGPSATLSTNTVLTDVNGMARVAATANATAGGPYYVTASYPTSGFAVFKLTNLPPPVFTVTTLADDATGAPGNCNDTSTGNTPTSGCSLRDAIAAAAAVSTSTLTPTVNFAGTLGLSTTNQGDYNVTTGGTLTIANNMSIAGPGANLLSIDGGGTVEVFNISTGNTVAISGLTITNGSTSTNGGGIYNNGALTVGNSTFSGDSASSPYPNGQGGAIFNDGSGVLTVTNSVFNGNSAAWQGAAILDNNILTVTNSTFSANTAQGGAAILVDPGVTATVTGSSFTGNTSMAGSAIFSTGNVTVNNSTFSGNTAQGGDGEGAAIFQWGTSGMLTVTNSTFSGNIAQNSGGGIYNLDSTVTLSNTIAAGNTAGGGADDVNGGAYTDQGGNVVSYSGGSQINAAVVSLAPLGNYGGPTKTMPPLPGSAAICSGLPVNATNAGLTTDQRGNPRSNSTYPGYSTTACVDAGAVQTNYSLSFTAPRSVEPFSPEVAGETFLLPAPAVTLLESGVAFADGHDPITIPLTLAGNGVLTGGSAVTDDVIADATAGVATYAGLSVNQTGTGDTLTASLPLNASLTPALTVSAVSSPFDVQAPILAFGTAPPATVAPGGNAGIVTVNVESSPGVVVTTATDQITLVVTGPGTYTASYSVPALQGVATFDLTSSALTIPSGYTYTASMAGANNLVANETVSAVATTLGLTSSVSPSSVDQQVTFTAQLAGGPFIVAPKGMVNFTINNGPSPDCPAVTVNAAGQATCTTSLLATPSGTIAASYSNDVNYTVATPASITQTVNPSPSTVTIASSPNTNSAWTVNQSVTFTATITPSVYPLPYSIVPFLSSGTVAFADNGTPITGCQAQPVVNVPGTTHAVATCAFSGFTSGNQGLTATFSGDANYTGNQSSTLNNSVSPFATTLNLSSNINPSSVNESIDITAQLFGGPFTVAPVGYVTFNANGTAITGCTSVKVNSSGAAGCVTSSLVAPSDSITATYIGDANYTVATPGLMAQTVTQLTPALNVTASPSSTTNVHSMVTFTAQLGTIYYSLSPVVPTGSIAFTINGASSPDCPAIPLASNLTATCTTSSLLAPSDAIAATYSGDTNFTTATGSITQTVNKLASAISVTSNLNPAFSGDTVTYTAAVGFASGSGATGPTGTVTFYDGATPITACAGLTLGAYNSTTGAATAACAVSYTSAAPATHSITASYSGDLNFTVATSGTFTEAIADFTITAQNATFTVMPGASGQYTFTVSPMSPATSFPTAINLTVSGLPPGATYNFSPSATIAAGSGASTVTLNIQTALTTSQNPPNAGGKLASRLAGISLALLLLPFVSRWRKAGKRFSRMLPILLLLIAGMAAAVGLSGCGSNTGFFGQAQQSYTVTVTATSGTLSRTSNVTLTVE